VLALTHTSPNHQAPDGVGYADQGYSPSVAHRPRWSEVEDAVGRTRDGAPFDHRL